MKKFLLLLLLAPAAFAATADLSIGEIHLTVEIAGDLRGRQVTAIASQIEFADAPWWWSSEAAVAVTVR